MFVVSDYAGHYFPMVPLGWALQAAGHHVRLVCGPAHRETASATGLVPQDNGVDVDTVLQARISCYTDALAGRPQSPGLPILHPLTGAEMTDLKQFDWASFEPDYAARAAVSARDRTRAIIRFAREWRPELVLHDLLSAEGMLAAHVTGVPSVCHLWGPNGTHETGPGSEQLRPDVPGPIRERLGIAPELELLRHVIDPCPDAIAPPTLATRLPVRYTPYNGPGAMQPWVLEQPRRPRICLAWSTSLTRLFGPRSFLVPQVIEACADLDVELVVAVNDADADALGPVPEFVRVLRSFPLHLVLPSCSAVVHHGGAGTLMTALTAGVPQLGLPFSPVLEASAGRIADAGAGLMLHGSTADPVSIRGALRALLGGPGFAAAARKLAEDNASRPTQAELVTVLEELAGA